MIEYPQNKWTWTENKVQWWESLKSDYHRTVDIYSVFNMEP